MKKFILSLIVLGMFFSGCSRLYNSNEVNLYDTNRVLTYENGVVEDVRRVVIKDDGSGTFIGAYTGAVLGSMFGEGKGNILSTLIGGLTGAFVGYESDKANAEELFIKLDDGKNIVGIVKGIDILRGDRVRIIKEGNRIIRVEKLL